MNKIKQTLSENGVTNAHLFWNILAIVLIYTVPLFWGLEGLMNIQAIFCIITDMLFIGMFFDGENSDSFKFFFMWFNVAGVIILLFMFAIALCVWIALTISPHISKFNKWINKEKE